MASLGRSATVSWRSCRGVRAVQTLGIYGAPPGDNRTIKRPPGKSKHYPEASGAYWQPSKQILGRPVVCLQLSFSGALWVVWVCAFWCLGAGDSARHASALTQHPYAVCAPPLLLRGGLLMSPGVCTHAPGPRRALVPHVPLSTPVVDPPYGAGMSLVCASQCTGIADMWAAAL